MQIDAHADSASAHDAETFGGMLFHSNGILVGDPVWPERGAYVRQCIVSVHKGTHLPWYWTPPSDRSDRLPPVYRGLAAGTVFGPVHQVEDTLDKEGFISVLVPPPLCKVPREDRETHPDLVWINIFTNRQGGREVRHHYCTVVAEAEVASWRRLGWKDVWIDQPNLIMRPLDAPPLAPSSASADQALLPLPAPAPSWLDRDPGQVQEEGTIDSSRAAKPAPAESYARTNRWSKMKSAKAAPLESGPLLSAAAARGEASGIRASSPLP